MKLKQIQLAAMLAAATVVLAMSSMPDSATAMPVLATGHAPMAQPAAAETFSSVTVGEGFTCVLRATGARAGHPFCWGANPAGQISVPHTTLLGITAGANYVCGRRLDKSLLCWGARINVNRTLPAGPLKQVAAGSDFACVLRTTGYPYCWGDNVLGQRDAPNVKMTQISLDSDYGCGLRPSGVPVCWGGNTVPSTTMKFAKIATAGGEAPCGITTSGSIRCFGPGSPGLHVPGGTFSRISGGDGEYCAIRAPDVSIHCWGTVGTPPPATGSYTAVSLRGGTGCALNTGQRLVCWGDNSYGQAALPVSRFTQVSSANVYACGLHADGSVRCWEKQQEGYPAPVVPGTFKQISSGYDFGCGILTSGSLSCWGANGSGQATPPAGTFTNVSAGDALACGVRTAGSLVCWGDPAHGDTHPPGGRFGQVSASLDFACATGAGHAVACWGDDTFGQLDPIAASPPRLTQVSAGFGFACGVRPAPYYWTDCWGGDGSEYIVLKTKSVSAGMELACGTAALTGEPRCWGNKADRLVTPKAHINALSVGGMQDPFVCGLQQGGVRCWGTLPLWIPLFR